MAVAARRLQQGLQPTPLRVGQLLGYMTLRYGFLCTAPIAFRIHPLVFRQILRLSRAENPGHSRAYLTNSAGQLSRTNDVFQTRQLSVKVR
jgi:hypothetical protein